MAVEQPVGSGIADGGSADFGATMVGGSISLTFTVRNTGVVVLSGIAPAIAGEAGDFTLNTSGLTPALSPGGSTTFTVTFAPTSTGVRTAALQIASSDAENNPFDITLTGTGTDPLTPGIVVEQPVGNILIDGGSEIDFGTVNGGFAGLVKHFTVRNTGSTALSGLAVSKDGANASDFLVNTSGMATLLSPGGTTSFTVTFLPIADGLRTAAIHLASTDPNRNPFDVALSGTGVLLMVPVIAVEQPVGTPLANGTSTLAFGGVNAGSAGTAMTVTIRNTGLADLTGITVTKDGAHAGEFTLDTTGMASTVAAGASTTFAVNFVPASVGVRSAALHISSNDTSNNPFHLGLSGLGVATPDISIEYPEGTGLTDGDAAVSFGEVDIRGAGVTKVFTVRNNGWSDLTGVAVTADGPQAGSFQVDVTGMATTLAPGTRTTFAVTFDPVAVGNNAATLHVAGNDPDENPFDIALGGVALQLPDIAVEQPVGNGLTSGGPAVLFADVNVGVAGAPMTFTVRNTGTANLTGLTLSVDGDNAGDFLADPGGMATTLAPDASTTFTVIFAPLGAGPRLAVLRVASNDPDEQPFVISVAGTGVGVPMIQVEGPNGAVLVDGGDAVLFGAGDTGVDKVFTIRNRGSAPLTGVLVTKAWANAVDFRVNLSGTLGVLMPGASTTFVVTLLPGATGLGTALLQVGSNDPDEAPFDIVLRSTSGPAPNIVVEQPRGTVVVQRGTVGFAPVTVGRKATLMFTLKNTGNANLTGVRVTVSDPDAGEFKPVSYPSAVIKPGKVRTFKVQFAPNSPGVKAALLTIFSNDPDESSFYVNLTATAVSGRDGDAKVAKGRAGSGHARGEAPTGLGVAETGIDEDGAGALDLSGTTWELPMTSRLSVAGVAAEDGEGVLRLCFLPDGRLWLDDGSGFGLAGSWSADVNGELSARVFAESVEDYLSEALGDKAGRKITVGPVEFDLRVEGDPDNPVMTARFACTATLDLLGGDAGNGSGEGLSWEMDASGPEW